MEPGRRKKKGVTIAELYDIAVGDLGLKSYEFERMSWGEFMCRHRGHIRAHEQRTRELRMLMWSAIAPHSRKRLKPQDIMQLPEDKVDNRIDPDEYEALTTNDPEKYKSLIDGKQDA